MDGHKFLQTLFLDFITACCAYREYVFKVIFFSIKTYVSGAQNNRLNEMMNKKIGDVSFKLMLTVKLFHSHAFLYLCFVYCILENE